MAGVLPRCVPARAFASVPASLTRRFAVAPHLLCACAQIEDLTIAFEHSYSTTAKLFHWNGTSNRPACDAGAIEDATCTKRPLDTYWVHGSNVDRDPAGSTTRIPLRDVLTDIGITLDEDNLETTVDCRDMDPIDPNSCAPGSDAPVTSGIGAGSAGAENVAGFPRHPKFRMTGMRINIDLQYTNRKDAEYDPRVTTERPPFRDSNVTCYIKAERAPTGWAGAGPEYHIFEPTVYDADGVKSEVKTTRYRQSIELVFRPAGRIYIFDPIFLALFIVQLFVYTAISKLICDMVCFYLLPFGGTSTVLRNKRAERVNKVSAFAQMGMQAATYVQAFQSLDRGNKGYLEAKDLVAVFGNVEGVDKEQALQMAQTVLRAAAKEAKGADDAEVGQIRFNDFMSLMEGGDTLNFNQFVKHVHTTSGSKKYLGRLSTKEAQPQHQAMYTPSL